MAIFGYKKVYRYYDIERRERRGYYMGKQTPSSQEGFDFTDAYMPQFNIEVSGLPKTVQLLELANGVTYNIELLDLQNASGSTKRLNFRVFYNDKDGNIISSISMPAGYETYVTLSNNGIIDNKIQLYPCLVVPDYYNATTQGANPTSIYTGSIIFRNDSETSLWPQLNQFYTTDFLFRGNRPYYTRYGGNKTYYNEDDFSASWLTVIQNGGDGTPITPIMPTDDTSGTGGGDSGDPHYDPFSDDVNFPNIPTVSALDSGFISAYSPTESQLRDLASDMWSGSFVDDLLKIWNSPIEGIVSLHMVPFSPVTSGSVVCKIGNYNTHVSMPKITNQFIRKDGGSIHVDERWCSALDYSPYTRAFIHIPFVGIQPVNIDDIMNKTIVLDYAIDVLTGTAVAMLKCGGAVLYEFPCNLAMKIPFTMSDHQLLYNQLCNVLTDTMQAYANPTPSAVAGAISSALNVVTSKHSTVQKSGSISGAYGMMDIFDAYLIMHRPIQSLAEDFAHFKGYPCNITYTLSALSGYTEVEYAHLEGVTATDAEKEEIQSLLSQGVIL